MSNFMEWARHGIKRGRFEMDRRILVRVGAAVVTVTLLAALYLMLVSQTAARGRHIQQLQAELFRLQRESEQLEVDIARAGSVSNLRERALELGFGPAEQVVFLPLATSEEE